MSENLREAEENCDFRSRKDPFLHTGNDRRLTQLAELEVFGHLQVKDRDRENQSGRQQLESQEET